MFDNEPFNEGFEEPDFMDEVRMRALWEEEIRISMEYTWSTIEETRIDVWVRSLPIEPDRKRTILNNLIEFFQEREEYEKCAILQKGFQFV